MDADHVTVPDVSQQSDRVPADWHNPVPIPFLVVKEGGFLFSIAPRNSLDEEAKAGLPDVMLALSNALDYMGAGAKTATGYGRMLGDEVANNRLEKIQRQAAQGAMSPYDRYCDELCSVTDKQVAEKFGKDFNKTKESAGDDWELQLDALFVEKKALVLSWRDADKKSAEGKAYKKLKNEYGRLN